MFFGPKILFVITSCRFLLTKVSNYFLLIKSKGFYFGKMLLFITIFLHLSGSKSRLLCVADYSREENEKSSLHFIFGDTESEKINKVFVVECSIVRRNELCLPKVALRHQMYWDKNRRMQNVFQSAQSTSFETSILTFECFLSTVVGVCSELLSSTNNSHSVDQKTLVDSVKKTVLEDVTKMAKIKSTKKLLAKQYTLMWSEVGPPTRGEFFSLPLHHPLSFNKERRGSLALSLCSENHIEGGECYGDENKPNKNWAFPRTITTAMAVVCFVFILLFWFYRVCFLLVKSEESSN